MVLLVEGHVFESVVAHYSFKIAVLGREMELEGEIFVYFCVVFGLVSVQNFLDFEPFGDFLTKLFFASFAEFIKLSCVGAFVTVRVRVDVYSEICRDSRVFSYTIWV